MTNNASGRLLSSKWLWFVVVAVAIFVAIGFLFVTSLKRLIRKGYENRGDTWYYTDWNEGVGRYDIKLSNDPAFKICEKNIRYARDSQNVWFDGHPVVGADAASFEVLGERHSRDRNRVFVIGVEIPEADPQTFKPLEGFFGIDKSSIFCGNVRVLSASDPLDLGSKDTGYSTYPNFDAFVEINGEGEWTQIRSFKGPIIVEQRIWKSGNKTLRGVVEKKP